MGPVIARALWLAFAFASASAAAPQEVPAFRSSVEMVAIPCVVVDGHGAAVTGLTRADFRVTDNGVRRVIESFSQETDQPLNLAVIVDASESQAGQLVEHRQMAAKLIEKLLDPGDRPFVIQVAEDIRLWPDLTSTTAGELFGDPCPKKPSGVPGLRAVSVCGASPLWNALYEAARLKLRPLKGTKALLILTDGFDTGSTHTWRQAADEAHRADATVYAIQYPSTFGGSFAPDLYKLVAETGGTTFRAAKDYDAMITRMETDLRHRYVLTFRPERLSGKVRHEVEIVTIRPDLTVRARRIYFEPPQ
jgi:Ca-activated chloride channel homolog